MKKLKSGCSLLLVVLLLASLQPPPAAGQISGLPFLPAAALGLAGVGGAILIGGGLGALAADATNRALGRGRSRSNNNYNYRRGKRQAKSDLVEDNVKYALEELAALDVNDCGKRYLCEIAALPLEQRSKQEKMTVNLFQGKGEDDSIEIADFRSAVHFGLVNRNQLTCVHRYKLCALSKVAINQLMKAEGLDTEVNLV